MDEKTLEIRQSSKLQCNVNALKAVNEMGLPKAVSISVDSFFWLGSKTFRTASQELGFLSRVHGDNLPYLIGLSIHEAWFALFASAGYVALAIDHEEVGENDLSQKIATAEGYGENVGLARALYEHLDDDVETQQRATFRDGTPFEEPLSLDDILKGAAMYWFSAAASSYISGDVKGAFDWLSEAQDALLLANGEFMWDEGARYEKYESESAMENSLNAVSAARTALAKSAARARHSENHAMKAEVFQWLDSQTKFPSNEAAGSAIIKQQPIAHVTARNWHKEWKKLRSASTP